MIYSLFRRNNDHTVRFRIILLLVFLASVMQAEVPAGYYSTATGTGAVLKTQLYNIIKDHTVRSYTQLWTDFQYTDVRSDNLVWDMYSASNYVFVTDQCGSSQVGCYNREHSFPKSWFGGEIAPMYTDLVHLIPVDGSSNTNRSDNPYGIVASATWTSSNGSEKGPNTYSTDFTGTVFEPIDEYKGDLARIYFYMATRYENIISDWDLSSPEADAVLNGSWFQVYEQWYLDMIYEWHLADPVSQKEIDRNNAIYSIQGNRNPYVDQPDYVYDVWSSVLTNPVEPGIPEPSSYPTNFSARSIQLNWTDAVGAVQPEYYLIRISTTGFNDIALPLDGVAYPDSATDRNITAGKQKATISNLNPGTYYIKIFGYTGTGTTTDYKTDGTLPQVSITVP